MFYACREGVWALGKNWSREIVCEQDCSECPEYVHKRSSAELITGTEAASRLGATGGLVGVVVQETGGWSHMEIGVSDKE